MIAMKHFTSCVIFLPGSSISQRSGGATATGCSQAPALSGFKKWECVCLCVCVCVRHVCGNRCASFVHYTPLCTRVDKWVTDVSVETDSKWWKMCLQQFSELFSWEQGPFSALEVIALSIKKKTKKRKTYWKWNFRQTLCEYTEPGPNSWSVKQLWAVYQRVITD